MDANVILSVVGFIGFVTLVVGIASYTPKD